MSQPVDIRFFQAAAVVTPTLTVAVIIGLEMP
jgi:hypothetical protein